MHINEQQEFKVQSVVDMITVLNLGTAIQNNSLDQKTSAIIFMLIYVCKSMIDWKMSRQLWDDGRVPKKLQFRQISILREILFKSTNAYLRF